MVTYLKKGHTNLISTKSSQLISQKMKCLTLFDEMPFRLRTNTPGGKTTEKKNNYSINKFTSCIEDDNSTFQREELIVVLLIIHHDAPIQMYTKTDECIYREN